MEVVQRVQSLSLGGLNELPAQFIRPAHERPENSKAVEGLTVPIISLSQPHSVVVEEVGKASREWGLFLIKDHGIPSSLIQRLKEVGQGFFELPQEERELYANDPSNGKFEGYGTKMTKNHDEKIEWIDYFFHFTAPPSKVNHHFWPQNPPSYRYVLIMEKEHPKNHFTFGLSSLTPIDIVLFLVIIDIVLLLLMSFLMGYN